MAELHTKESKFLSLILRHKPETIGITLDEHGWADVDALIAGVNRTGNYTLDRTMLEGIVRTDGKQRYSFSEDGTKIRANQGHSVQVDVELAEKEACAMEHAISGDSFRKMQKRYPL